LPGTHTQSYWSGIPFGRRQYSSDDQSAEDALIEVLALLEPHGEFLRRLRHEGGSVLLEVCSHGNENYALEFPPEFLSGVSAIGLSLVHDVYSVEQNW